MTFDEAVALDDAREERRTFVGRPRCSGCKGLFGQEFLAAHQRVCVLFQRQEQEYRVLRERLAEDRPRKGKGRGKKVKRPSVPGAFQLLETAGKVAERKGLN